MAQDWSKGDRAMYDGMEVTVLSIDSLVCNLEDDTGRVYRGRMLSNLKRVPRHLQSVGSTAADPSTSQPGNTAAAEAEQAANGVREAMDTPVTAPSAEAETPEPEAFPDIASPATGPSEPPLVDEEPAASKPTKGRKYREGGYPCDLCPDLPPFETAPQKANHVWAAHPKDKSAKTPKVSPRKKAATKETRTESNSETLNSGDAELLRREAETLRGELGHSQELIEAFAMVMEYYTNR